MSGLKASTSSRKSRWSDLGKPQTAQTSKHKLPRDTKGLLPKGRGVGKLKGLVDLPVDVFIEIAARVPPLYLINLSRASKHFRSVFMARAMRSCWIKCLKNVPGLPICPSDMNEVQYAVLMFDNPTCWACGSTQKTIVDYGLRVRFCSPCWAENITHGSVILSSYESLPPVVYTLVPHTWSYTSFSSAPSSISNTSRHTYYSPELALAAATYVKLSSIGGNEQNLQKFIEERQTIATSMMKEGTVLYKFAADYPTRQARQAELEARQAASDKSARERWVINKLVAVGWKIEDIDASGAVGAAIALSCPVSEEEWSTIVSNLEKRRKKAPKNNIIYPHRKQIAERYEALSIELSEQGHDFVPGWLDARKMPGMHTLLMDFLSPFRETTWESLLPAIVSWVQNFKFCCQDDLLNLLYLEHYSWDRAFNLSVLQRASSLVSFDGNLIHSSEVFAQYAHSKDTIGWQELVSRCGPMLSSETYTFYPRARRTAIGLLKRLGYAEDVPNSELNVLGDGFTCLAQCPIRGSMTFPELVQHYMSEEDWYDWMVSARDAWQEGDKTLVLRNDHDVTNNSPVAVDEAALDASESVSVDEKSRTLRRCTWCIRMANVASECHTLSQMTYHMRAKHLKAYEEGDFR